MSKRLNRSGPGGRFNSRWSKSQILASKKFQFSLNFKNPQNFFYKIHKLFCFVLQFIERENVYNWNRRCVLKAQLSKSTMYIVHINTKSIFRIVFYWNYIKRENSRFCVNSIKKYKLELNLMATEFPRFLKIFCLKCKVC